MVKKNKILHVVDENYKFKFLDDKIENAGQYGVCHQISESFYTILLETN